MVEGDVICAGADVGTHFAAHPIETVVLGCNCTTDLQENFTMNWRGGVDHTSFSGRL